MQFGNNSEKKNGLNILDLEASTLKSVNQGFCWLENKNDKRKKARFIKFRAKDFYTDLAAMKTIASLLSPETATVLLGEANKQVFYFIGILLYR